MPDALMLLAALAASMVGMGWLALGLETHWRQVHGHLPHIPGAPRWLRAMGAIGILSALGLCLAVDHASMAFLVWVMTLTAAAIMIAFVLTWRPSWLRSLAPWVRHQQSRR